jgi:hypothetical protein
MEVNVLDRFVTCTARLFKDGICADFHNIAWVS